MEAETILAKEISAAGIKARYDSSCKRLLSQKVFLARIMKECLIEYQDCSIDQIIDQYIEGEPSVEKIPVAPDETNPVIQGIRSEDTSITEGTVTYDIRFLAYAPVSGERIRLIINVESQNRWSPGYPLLKRAIYYCSRMISAQYGTEFTNSQYGQIAKVYSIWICPSPPQDHQHTITRYRMTEENVVGNVREPVSHYDLMTVIMLGLGDPENIQDDNVLRLLSVLLMPKIGDAEKKRILQEEFAIPMTEDLERSIDQMCNLSEGVMAKGRAEGRKEGRAEATVTLIRNLMDSASISIEKAMSMLKISEEDREKYIELLEKQ